MNTAKKPSQVFKPINYGGVQVDPVGNTYTSSNGVYPVEPQVMRLFIFLHQNLGKTVTRQALLDHCWDQQFVSDEALTQVISKLRKTLKKSGIETPCLKTVSRKGYQLVPQDIASPVAAVSRKLPGTSHPYLWPGIAALLVLGFSLYLAFFNDQESLEDLLDEEAIDEALEDALKDQ